MSTLSNRPLISHNAATTAAAAAAAAAATTTTEDDTPAILPTTTTIATSTNNMDSVKTSLICILESHSRITRRSVHSFVNPSYCDHYTSTRNTGASTELLSKRTQQQFPLPAYKNTAYS
ncbi:hypothetical protein SprV_0401593900 [Sparganum proliferum]